MEVVAFVAAGVLAGFVLGRLWERLRWVRAGNARSYERQVVVSGGRWYWVRRVDGP